MSDKPKSLKNRLLSVIKQLDEDDLYYRGKMKNSVKKLLRQK